MSVAISKRLPLMTRTAFDTGRDRQRRWAFSRTRDISAIGEAKGSALRDYLRAQVIVTLAEIVCSPAATGTVAARIMPATVPIGRG